MVMKGRGIGAGGNHVYDHGDAGLYESPNSAIKSWVDLPLTLQVIFLVAR